MRTFPSLLIHLLPSLTFALTPISLPVRALNDGFQKTKFKVESGGEESRKRPAPNLSDEQVKEFDEFLRSRGQHVDPAERERLLERVRGILWALDIAYKEPIPPAAWERLLRESRESFSASAPASSARDWEHSIDEMLQGLVSKVGDPHSYYLNRERAAEAMVESRGISYGLGVYTEKGGRGLKLRMVLPDSPAEKAGLRIGDEILSVDKHALEGLEFSVMRNFLYKPVGEPMTLRLLRAGSELRVVVARGELRTPNPHSRMAAPGIGYVHFGEFGDKEDEKVFAAIDALKAAGARKLILDVRSNPGGYVHIARSIASEFLEADQRIDIFKKRGVVNETAAADGPGRYLGMPLAILVNEDSASASELLSAALQDHRRATIVGARTYGKGTYQSPHQTVLENKDISDDSEESLPYYPDGTMLMLSEGTWHTPNGRWVQGRYDPTLGRNAPGSGGVRPDAVVELSAAQKDAVETGLLLQLYGRGTNFPDPTLERALQVLQRR